MMIGIHTFFHREDVMHNTTSVGQGGSFNEISYTYKFITIMRLIFTIPPDLE